MIELAIREISQLKQRIGLIETYLVTEIKMRDEIKMKKRKQNLLSLDEILRSVANDFNLKTEDIKGSSHNDKHVTARVVFYHVCSDRGFSNTKSGRYLNRDHSSVSYHFKHNPILLRYSQYIEHKKEIEMALDSLNQGYLINKPKIDEA